MRGFLLIANLVRLQDLSDKWTVIVKRAEQDRSFRVGLQPGAANRPQLHAENRVPQCKLCNRGRFTVVWLQVELVCLMLVFPSRPMRIQGRFAGVWLHDALDTKVATRQTVSSPGERGSRRGLKQVSPFKHLS